MIEGGRMGALFFNVCFFSWRCTNQAFFLYLWKVKMADEWKDAVGKERTKGVRVHRGVLTRAGEFLPFFFSLFSLSSLYFFMEEEVNDDVVWKERLWERFQPFNFLKRSLVPREFDSLKSESSSFFFSGALHYIYIGCHPIVIEEYPCVFVKTHVYISRQMAEWYLFCESLDSWAALPSSVAKRWRLALLCEPFTIAIEASLWATVTLFYSVNTGAKWWSFPQKIQLSLRAKATESKREKNFFFLAWRR